MSPAFNATARDWRHRALRLLRACASAVSSSPRLEVYRIDSLAGYRDHIARHGASAWEVEEALARAHPDGEFKVEGRCWIDAMPVAFEMDYLYSLDLGTRRLPNWRERLLCPVCRLNNRQRASLHVGVEILGLKPRWRIYMTEQVTPAFAVMRTRYPNVVGSEYLGDGAAPGAVDANGIRHEDLTRLSFADGSLDAILSFDVLEHVPDPRKALSECLRVLRRGGRMLFSAPFLQDEQVTRTRARIASDGAIVHDLPPVYHGDPMKPGEGVLCFHEFGWDVLQLARDCGFGSATALLYRAPRYGYLGGWQVLFLAQR